MNEFHLGLAELLFERVGRPAAWAEPWVAGLIDAAAILAITWIVGWLLTKIVIRGIHHLTKQTTTDLDDQIVTLVHGPLRNLVLLVGVYYALLVLPLDRVAWRIGTGIIFAIGVWITVRLVVRVVLVLVTAYGKRVTDPAGRQSFEKDYLPLVSKIVTVVLVVVGLIAVLNHFDQDVSSLVAALGVGGIAISFAARDTLSNMISGFTILLDRPFRPGDRIKLATGEIGDVIEVGTRATRVKLTDLNMLIVPNSELVNSRVVNFNYPAHSAQARFEIGIAYGADIVKAKEIIGGVIQAQPEVLAEPKPTVLLVGFGESAIGLGVTYTVSEHSDLGAVQDRVRMQVYEGFARAGIKIPYPTREVVVRSAGSATIGG